MLIYTVPSVVPPILLRNWSMETLGVGEVGGLPSAGATINVKLEMDNYKVYLKILVSFGYKE